MRPHSSTNATPKLPLRPPALTARVGADHTLRMLSLHALSRLLFRFPLTMRHTPVRTQCSPPWPLRRLVAYFALGVRREHEFFGGAWVPDKIALEVRQFHFPVENAVEKERELLRTRIEDARQSPLPFVKRQPRWPRRRRQLRCRKPEVTRREPSSGSRSRDGFNLLRVDVGLTCRHQQAFAGACHRDI